MNKKILPFLLAAMLVSSVSLCSLAEEAAEDKAEAAEDFVSGIKTAEKKAGKDGIVVCFGSLYLAGHIRVEYAKLHK